MKNKPQSSCFACKTPVSMDELHFPMRESCRAKQAAQWLKMTFPGRAIA
ncbi:MAG: hypothetical protein AAGA75_17080 [Cyanobacteria bacterium P01_E01_bin.6]